MKSDGEGSGGEGRRRLLRAGLAAGAALALPRGASAASRETERRGATDGVGERAPDTGSDAPPRPDYLESYRDRDFGHRITRVVDDPARPVAGRGWLWGAPSRHIYSKVAAWDSSDRWIAIRSAGARRPDGSGAPEWLLLDDEGYAPRGAITRPFVEFRWWNTRPARMFLVAQDALVDHDPFGGEERVLAIGERLFAEYTELSLGWEGNLSDDDATVALLGKSRRDRRPHALVCSLERDELLAAVALDDHPRVDFASVTPSGRHLLVNGELEPGRPDRTRVLDLEGRAVGDLWEPYGTPSHFDLATDARGRDIAVGVAKSASGDVRPGAVVARVVEDGALVPLIEGGYAMHTSCRNLAAPGWCFVSYVGRFPKRYPPFGDELVAVRLDGSGRHRRLCRFQHVEGGYWAQPQACPDTRGRRAVFASNWRDPAGAVQAYVVETGGLPS